jgi:hypothetical protein
LLGAADANAGLEIVKGDGTTTYDSTDITFELERFDDYSSTFSGQYNPNFSVRTSLDRYPFEAIRVGIRTEDSNLKYNSHLKDGSFSVILSDNDSSSVQIINQDEGDFDHSPVCHYRSANKKEKEKIRTINNSLRELANHMSHYRFKFPKNDLKKILGYTPEDFSECIAKTKRKK